MSVSEVHHPPRSDALMAAPGLSRLVITIDGPAGTGKSSVARLLARRLGLDFLDTGAMYRAAAALALDARLDIDAPGGQGAQAVVRAVDDAQLGFDWSTDPPTILAHGRSIGHRIREADVTGVVSHVASIVPLRAWMVERQRAIAKAHPRLVTEGRDQGSVVFPEAPVKFYLDADARVRAQRRADQLRAGAGTGPAGGAEPAINLDALMAEIEARDRSDASRADGPLVCPAGAIRFDTSMLTQNEVVDALERVVLQRLAGLAV
jgi:CMP/dCMP kinase